MINKKIEMYDELVTYDFEDKYNKKYNVQMLSPDFTIDPHMKVIFEKPYKSNGILKRMTL